MLFLTWTKTLEKIRVFPWNIIQLFLIDKDRGQYLPAWLDMRRTGISLGSFIRWKIINLTGVSCQLSYQFSRLVDQIEQILTVTDYQLERSDCAGAGGEKITILLGSVGPWQAAESIELRLVLWREFRDGNCSRFDRRDFSQRLISMF